MGGPNQNNSDKKNPAKGGVWVDITKLIVTKNILLRGEYGWI